MRQSYFQKLLKINRLDKRLQAGFSTAVVSGYIVFLGLIWFTAIPNGPLLLAFIAFSALALLLFVPALRRVEKLQERKTQELVENYISSHGVGSLTHDVRSLLAPGERVIEIEQAEERTYYTLRVTDDSLMLYYDDELVEPVENKRSTGVDLDYDIWEVVTGEKND